MSDITNTTTTNKNRENGVYYTSVFNPFTHSAFGEWAKKIDIKNQKILEPFAGSNNIISMLSDIGLCNNFVSYDIAPQSNKVSFRDTIKSFPDNFDVCITNPPWIYKSSARRRKLYYPDTHWDNVYKHCLSLCLSHCNFVGVLLPASFLQSNIFLDRLETIIFIQKKLFEYTENPVCLALFNKEKVSDTNIYLDDRKVGTLSQLSKYLPKKQTANMTFNAPKGALGLIGIDNTKCPSIRFCEGSELDDKYNINHSSRSITRIDGVAVTQSLIQILNHRLNEFRIKTNDIFLTPFKGLREDGMYRKRLDFSLARKLIGECV